MITCRMGRFGHVQIFCFPLVLQKQSPRIVGGTTVEIGTAPWQAQLYRVRDNKKLSFQVRLLLIPYE